MSLTYNRAKVDAAVDRVRDYARRVEADSETELDDFATVLTNVIANQLLLADAVDRLHHGMRLRPSREW